MGLIADGAHGKERDSYFSVQYPKMCDFQSFLKGEAQSKQCVHAFFDQSFQPQEAKCFDIMRNCDRVFIYPTFKSSGFL